MCLRTSWHVYTLYELVSLLRWRGRVFYGLLLRLGDLRSGTSFLINWSGCYSPEHETKHAETETQCLITWACPPSHEQVTAAQWHTHTGSQSSVCDLPPNTGQMVVLSQSEILSQSLTLPLSSVLDSLSSYKTRPAESRPVYSKVSFSQPMTNKTITFIRFRT